MIKMIKVEPYGRKLWIVWNSSESELRHALARENDDYSAAYKFGKDSEGVTVTTGKGHVVMRFHEEPNDPRLIAHESLHAAWGILDRIGVKMSDDSEEALAYLMDWIIGQVYETKTTSEEVAPLSASDN
jgi:hypothetical protein